MWVMLHDGHAIRQADRRESPSAHDPAFAPIETKTITQVIVDRLIALIKAGTFQSGEKLPSEKELMKRFEVGRSSVREALHSLVTLRLLEARPGKGYFVSDRLLNIPKDLLDNLASKERDFLNLMEAREALEIAIARAAVKRATPHDLRQLEEIYEEISRAAEQGEDLLRFTGKIHLAIAAATHNSVFVRLLEALMPLWPIKTMRRAISAEEHLRLHRKLIDGLYEKDGKKIVQLMRQHLSITREYYLGSAWEQARFLDSAD